MGLGPNFRWRSGLPVNDERASIGFLEYRIDAAEDGRFRYLGVVTALQRSWLALRPRAHRNDLLQGREVVVFDRRLRAGQVIEINKHGGSVELFDPRVEGRAQTRARGGLLRNGPPAHERELARVLYEGNQRGGREVFGQVNRAFRSEEHTSELQ